MPMLCEISLDSRDMASLVQNASCYGVENFDMPENFFHIQRKEIHSNHSNHLQNDCKMSENH